MHLIIGLGNPGKKYEGTRHNAGFMVADALQKTHGFSAWQAKKQYSSMFSNGTIVKEEIALAKPQTFMNNSGDAAKRLIKNLGISSDNLIVIHDDIDLPLGGIKIVRNRGSAGHKGVNSIIQKLGTKNFIRLRVGIAPDRIVPAAEIVLESFSKREKTLLKEVKKKSLLAIELITQGKLAEAMTEYNK